MYQEYIFLVPSNHLRAAWAGSSKAMRSSYPRTARPILHQAMVPRGVPLKSPPIITRGRHLFTANFTPLHCYEGP